MLIINTGQDGRSISAVKGASSASAGTQFYILTKYGLSSIDLNPTTWVHI